MIKQIRGSNSSFKIDIVAEKTIPEDIVLLMKQYIPDLEIIEDEDEVVIPFVKLIGIRNKGKK